ncbi:MAG: xanthine dehydrogenase family protein subunit M [Burkholderiales bacterium]
MDYVSVSDLEEAIRLRQQTGFAVLAGGTDVYPALENGIRIPGVIDITAVEALRAPIRREGDVWTIPTLTTWTDVIEASLPPQFDALKQAAAEVGGRQIQNTGTVGGNICNASPAADGVAALLALDASVVLRGTKGTRAVPLADFIQGNRRTALAPDEILTAVRVPAATGRHASLFKKLGARRYLVISIVMTAVLIELDEARAVRRAAIAVGACADRALRLPAAENALRGVEADGLARYELPDEAVALLAPIDDVRGSAAYRRHAVKALVEQAIHEISRGLSA